MAWRVCKLELVGSGRCGECSAPCGQPCTKSNHHPCAHGRRSRHSRHGTPEPSRIPHSPQADAQAAGAVARREALPQPVLLRLLRPKGQQVAVQVGAPAGYSPRVVQSIASSRPGEQAAARDAATRCTDIHTRVYIVHLPFFSITVYSSAPGCLLGVSIASSAAGKHTDLRPNPQKVMPPLERHLTWGRRSCCSRRRSGRGTCSRLPGSRGSWSPPSRPSAGQMRGSILELGQQQQRPLRQVWGQPAQSP